MNKKPTLLQVFYAFFLGLLLFASVNKIEAQVTLETEVKITDFGLHFNGNFESNRNVPDNGNPDSYSYVFGRNISAHGDAVKAFGDYVFMTWYRGGKLDRHMMLSRYNTVTGTVATIEFPHRHTGFQNRWWLGESHNTIAVGISPLDGTIHLLYDMHAYSPSKPSDGSLANDYFRYSYSLPNTATVSDADFTIDRFVKDNGVEGDFTHLRTPGNVNQSEFLALTYPRFFLNDEGDLLFFMREGGNNNGMYKFSKYDASKGEWQNFTDFNRLNARSQPGITFNWGLYGDIKYANGKIRIGFQRRSSNNNDKFLFQNGVYYAYSDDPSGASQWKNHRGEPISLPLLDADDIKIMEPGDFVETTGVGRVRIVGGFDWTVTANGDVHIKSEVKDLDNNQTKRLHTYKAAGASDFITKEQTIAGSFYTSGPNVYAVGLINGKVVVDKAEGGTDNFERVYQATGGRTFDHGVVHIENGKAYFYLMEKKSGSAQPLYLQIIDLDIDPVDPTLPNNFTIQTVSETCVGKGNGKLTINAAAAFNYTTSINGVNYDFTKNLEIEDLSPGTYDFCIDLDGIDQRYCYQVEIEGGVSLSGKMEVVKQAVEVSVDSGVPPYSVFKNGIKIMETNQTSFYVNANHGDTIVVKSKDACQGEMGTTVNLFETIKAYPNPSSGVFEIFMPNVDKEVNVEIYNIHSQLVATNTLAPNTNRMTLDIEDKPNGIYFAKVGFENPVFLKLIKK